MYSHDFSKIAIIGGGNLGCAMATGLLQSGFTSEPDLIITARQPERLKRFSQKGIAVTSDNQKAVDNATIIILAAKPFQLQDMLTRLSFTPGKLIISLVSGVTLETISGWIGEEHAIFRAMPNIAVSIRQSITCIATNKPGPDLEIVQRLFESLGRVLLIEEKLMDAATILGACGTAFAMRYMRACIQGGIEIGFNSEQASLVTEQTVLGAAALLMTGGCHPEQEIDKVTTPKGCTIAGLNEMEHGGFSSALIKGLVKSYRQIQIG